MKGLLLKDLKVLSKNKKAYVILFFVVIMMMLNQSNSNHIFIISYVIILLGMMSVNTISSDENGKCLPFLMTLPLTRETYVLEKYILVIISSLTGSAVVILGCAALDLGRINDILIEGSVIFLVFGLYYMIMLPLEFKYGDKSRIALFGLAALCLLIFMLSKTAASRFSLWINIDAAAGFAENIIAGILSLNRLLLGFIMCMIYLTGCAVSFFISVRIMRRREF